MRSDWLAFCPRIGTALLATINTLRLRNLSITFHFNPDLIIQTITVGVRYCCRNILISASQRITMKKNYTACLSNKVEKDISGYIACSYYYICTAQIHHHFLKLLPHNIHFKNTRSFFFFKETVIVSSEDKATDVNNNRTLLCKHNEPLWNKVYKYLWNVNMVMQLSTIKNPYTPAHCHENSSEELQGQKPCVQHNNPYYILHHEL